LGEVMAQMADVIDHQKFQRKIDAIRSRPEIFDGIGVDVRMIAASCVL